jgi:hypothetical protein
LQESTPEDGLLFDWRITAFHSIPAILHTCQESRAEALKWYTLASGARLECPVYPDFECDTLAMPPYRTHEVGGYRTLEAFINESDLWASKMDLEMLHQKLRYLVISGDMLNVNSLKTMQAFPNLYRLVLPDV